MLASVATLALASTMLVAPIAAVADEPTDLLEGATRGSYGALTETGSDPWCFEVAAAPGGNVWDAAAFVNHFPVIDGADYTLSFDAWGAPAGTSIRLNVGIDEDPYPGVFDAMIELDEDPATFRYDFGAGGITSDLGQVGFQVGGHTQGFSFCVDDITLEWEPADLLEGATRGSYGALTETGSDPWCFEVAAAPGGNVWDAAAFVNHFPVIDGADYTLSFDAWGAPAGTSIRLNVGIDEDPYPGVFDAMIELDEDPATFRYDFVGNTTSDRGQVGFQVGGHTQGFSFCVDDIVLVQTSAGDPTPPAPGGNLIGGGGTPTPSLWWGVGSATVVDGQACLELAPGANLGYFGGFPIQTGEEYTLGFTASSDPAAAGFTVIVQVDGRADLTDLQEDFDATPEAQRFEYTFVGDALGGLVSSNNRLVFVNNSGASVDFCLGEVSLVGGQEEVYEPDTGPRVRVNQVGYLPDGPKNATLVTAATEPLDWELHDEHGEVVAGGESVPQGVDPSAGLNVHTIDFSSYTGSGEGFTLLADEEASYPFDISATLYSQLRKDALGIYYSQRSGIEIDGDIKPGYERPAGHVSEFGGDDVNQGDLGVPCLPNEGAVDHQGNAQLGGYAHYGEDGWDCPEGYALDVTGGWYDAGDHGKYVVNSGISVWQLLSTYERNQLAGVADRDALGDGTLAIPEAGNGMPDILDEVKWNLDWMLRMQVEDGIEMGIDGETIDAGGLVHHKLHDIAWTGMNTFPHEDPMPRYVHRPSTAATLNLAAAAAQGARLYVDHDPEYAFELLAAARRAWDAANEHPGILAPNTNVLDPNPGGGPYDDSQVSDEFYWAAAQLFLTTGEDEYLDAVMDSPHHTSEWDPTAAFDWQSVAAAARLDLALVASDLPNRDEVIGWVLEGADQYLAIQEAQPFGHPYGPEEYGWGSTHHVLNNAVVIAAAYDLSGEQRYLDGAIEAIDYVLGRNAINNSYVTAYGTHYSQNMHSRWYSHSLTDRMPPPPPGKVAGGANSGIQDPVAAANLQGCAPQFCYIDDIGSWSTNETTINWNAALAWHASWLDDMGSGQPDWQPPRSPEPGSKDACRHGMWNRFVDPSFRNQGQCVSSVAGPPGHAGPPARPGPPGHPGAGHGRGPR